MEYAIAAITTTNGRSRTTMRTIAVFKHLHEAEAVVDLIENTALDGAVLVIIDREATEPE